MNLKEKKFTKGYSFDVFNIDAQKAYKNTKYFFNPHDSSDINTIIIEVSCYRGYSKRKDGFLILVKFKIKNSSNSQNNEFTDYLHIEKYNELHDNRILTLKEKIDILYDIR